jgi:hypothetical protein
MDAMKNTILPLKKRNKHKKKRSLSFEAESDDDGIEKVHQDEDYSKFLWL